MNQAGKICLISPVTDLPGDWALLPLGSVPGLLRQILGTFQTYIFLQQTPGGIIFLISQNFELFPHFVRCFPI